MSAHADFLVELGTEELPPTALRGLRDAFAEGLAAEFEELRLEHGDIEAFASPRRLAVRIRALARRQPDRDVEAKGPPVSVAFDDDGSPKPPALAFAKKCGVAVEDLGRLETDKGSWLVHSSREEGSAAAALLGPAVEAALRRLPVPKPMRWGAGAAEFVRPVHWLVMLHGDDVVEASMLGVRAGNVTRGHRFHAPAPISLSGPEDYLDRLETEGYVIADLDRRLEQVRAQVEACASERGGRPVAGESLFDEVAALVEWPVPVLGEFDPKFLALPREVVVATFTNHQRYFPIENADGELMPAFVTAANIDSKEPGRVREGNERVILPRLADAAFFWETDQKLPLAERLETLDRVVYQKGLGTIGDKSRRVADLAVACASALGTEPSSAERAGLLAKCDLVTGMVGEFPELQGTMGGYYARASGESEDVSLAVSEHYRPRFAGDDIASGDAGRCVAIADKLDTLCGIFCLGKKPSGNRDPFALRRSALGIVRTIVEAPLEIDLPAIISTAVAAQPVTPKEPVGEDIYDFLVERLRAYAADRLSVTSEIFEAVRDRRPGSLADFVERLLAVQAFVELDEAASLAAANKRIGNILRQAKFQRGSPDAGLLSEAAEKRLADEIARASGEVEPLIDARDYRTALEVLAGLRSTVDGFFDDVMVMADDESVRDNRLALLASLRNLFLRVADISRLAIR